MLAHYYEHLMCYQSWNIGEVLLYMVPNRCKYSKQGWSSNLTTHPQSKFSPHSQKIEILKFNAYNMHAAVWHVKGTKIQQIQSQIEL